MGHWTRITFAALLLVLTFSAAIGAQGQGNRTADTSPDEGEHLDIVRAPVVVDGEELFSVRGISTHPAEQRADQIENRIRALAQSPQFDTSALTLEDHPGATWILANGRRILTVYDEDASFEVVDRHLLAEAFRAKIAESIVAYRAAREPAVLWRHASRALLATLVLLISVYLWWRSFGWVRTAVEQRYRERVHDVSIKSFPLIRAEQLWRVLSGILTLAWSAAAVAMVFVCLRYVLGLFPWTRGAASGLVAMVLRPVHNMALGVLAIIPNLIFLAILYVVTRSLLKVARLFFNGVAAGTVRLRNFDPEWAPPTYRLVRVFIIIFALVVAFPYVPGSETDAFKGVTIFLGLVFSLGSSSLIGNLISGYSMTYRRMFHVGDRVKIGEHVGEVIEMRLLVTHLRTPKNEEVIVPNSAIVGTEVVNYSSLAKKCGLILHTTVGIGYETPWRQVEAMLMEAAARTTGLLGDRQPFVYQTALGDFCVTYEINVYCDRPERMRQLYTELHRNILDVFNEYDVQIMTPAYEMDPVDRKTVPKERWYAPPAQPQVSPGGNGVSAGARSVTSGRSERSPS